MLLQRSCYLHFSLYVFLINAIYCQEYDAEHNAESDHDDHDHSSYSDGHYERPDYSKYYSVDSSAPIIQAPVNDHGSGFIPSEFEAFFGHSNFDFGGTASNKKEISKPTNKEFGFVTNSFKPVPASPIPNHDYFEESQQKNKENAELNTDSYESRPGPNYISHKVSPKQKHGASNVDEIEGEKENAEEFNFDSEKEDIKDIDDLYYDKAKDSGKYNKKNNIDVTTEKYNPDYVDGKSSYTAGTTNYSPDYYTRLTSTPSLTPYQKFSFQPVDDYSFKPITSESKIAPFNPNYNKYLPVPTINTDYVYPDATATVATKIANNKSNCKKINKLGTTSATKDQIMDCYSCEDPKTGHNYEQCSYSSEPTPTSYYFTNSKTYKPTERSHSYRYKRYAARDDPYEYVKAQAQSQYNPENEYNKQGEEYRFGPEYFEDDGEKNYSERESEKMVNEGEHCVRQKKQGMTCMVCKNEKTGGKYEQCAYATEPQEQKYAYVKQRKYNSKDIPEETEQTEQKPVKKQKYKKYSAKVKGEKPKKTVEVEYVKPIDTRRQRSEKLYVPKRKNAKPDPATDDEIHQYYKDSTLDKSDIVGVDTEDYYAGADEHENEELNEQAEVDDEEIEEEEPTKKKKSYTLSEYHFKLFPEFSNEESKKEEKRVQKPQKPAEQIKTEFDVDQTKDVEEVLAEFAKKDRSKCKKAEKQGMTCYLCIDDSGLQNEECMYISESKPKATYTAYHEAKELIDKKNRKKLQPEESQNVARKVKTAPAAFDVEATDSKQVDSTTSIPVGTSKLLRKYGRDKNISRPLSIPLDAAEEQLLESRIKRNTKYTKKTSKQSKKDKLTKDDDLLNAEDEIQLPIYEHEKLKGADGAYSAETRPVYSKVYDETLPKYMLEKSISEKEFDDFVTNS